MEAEEKYTDLGIDEIEFNFTRGYPEYFITLGEIEVERRITKKIMEGLL